MPVSIKEYLRRFVADEPLLDSLCKLFTAKEYQKDESLLCQGDFWKKVYFVESGLCRFYFVTEDGKEYNKNFFAQHSLFYPATSMMREEESLFYIGTLEDSLILEADFGSFAALLKNHGQWERFNLFFCEKLVDLKISREYEFLMYDAKSRYELFLKEHGSLKERIADYHLASYLGVTNVTLSRLKKHPK